MIQKQIGLKLLESLPQENNINKILDVGMGTGWLTEKIKERFSHAHVVGIDFAEGMVQQAKNKKIDCVIQADAQDLPFSDHSFDLIVSNCAYQWVDDLRQAFLMNHRVLINSGRFYFSCFGRDTLKELRSSFKNKNLSYDALFRNLPLTQEVTAAVKQAGFLAAEIKTEMMIVEFQDLFHLLRWIKAIGAKRASNQIFIGRDFLKQASALYQEHFASPNGISATFEVIWGTCQK